MEQFSRMKQKGATDFGSSELPDTVMFPTRSREAIWAALPLAKIDPHQLETNRIVSAGRSDSSRVAFDMLRTRVLHLMVQNNWTTVAITSPTPGGGKSVVALNLAYSLANREDCYTALIDLDLRRFRMAEILGFNNPPSIEKFLRGEAGVEQVFRRLRPNLAVAPNGQQVRLAAELLQSPFVVESFARLQEKLMPDIVVCDLPPMLANDDLIAFLPNVDCVILVVEAETNTLEEVDVCEHELSLQTNVLGVVLNKYRFGGTTGSGV